MANGGRLVWRTTKKSGPNRAGFAENFWNPLIRKYCCGSPLGIPPSGCFAVSSIFLFNEKHLL